MSIGLILDNSALLVHLRLERVSAGELIGEVALNGDVTGVPALAVLDILPELDVDDLRRLERILAADDGPIVLLPLLAHDVLEVGRVATLVKGGRGVAQAVVEANKYATSLATLHPSDIGDTMHPDDILVLS